MCFRKLINYGVVLILFLFSSSSLLFAQSKNYTLETSFYNKRIETESDKSCFNVLSITNRSNYTANIKVSFTLPENWNLMTESEKTYVIESGQNVLFPLRFSVAKSTRGGIGYVVVATIKTLDDRIVKTEYFFVAIKSNLSISITPLARYVFFDPVTQTCNAGLHIENKGNVDEIVNLNYEIENPLRIQGQQNNKLIYSVRIPAYSDTTVFHQVTINEDRRLTPSNSFKIKLLATNRETNYPTTYMLKRLDNQYSNEIPEMSKCLIAEVYAKHLFSLREPFITPAFWGAILFKKNRELTYLYRDNRYGKFTSFDNVMMHARYKEDKFEIQVGNITEQMMQTMYGRGVSTLVKLGSTSLRAIATKGIGYDSYREGVELTQKIKTNTTLIGGFAMVQTDQGRIKSSQPYGGVSFQLNKLNLSVLTGVSNTQRSYTQINNYKGTGVDIVANLRNVKNKEFSLNSHQGSKFFTGIYGGRNDINAQFINWFQDKSNIRINYIKSSIDYPVFLWDSLLRNQFTDMNLLITGYSKYVKPTINLYSELHTQTDKGTGLSYANPDMMFGTYTTAMKVGTRVTSNYFFNSINVGFKGGYTYTTHYAKDTISEGFASPDRRKYFNGLFNFGISSKKWGFFLFYYYGPRSLNEQYLYVYRNIFSKSLSLMPYFDGFVYKNKLRVSSRLNYYNFFNTKYRRLTFFNQIYWYFEHDWRLHILVTTNTTKRVDFKSDATLNYDETYAEIGIRKEFGCNQPRIKYYDLNIVFFKDLNGSRTQDVNEPGIKSVLLSMERDRNDSLFSSSNTGAFNPPDLLSDQTGRISYEKVPNGTYNLKYIPLGVNNDVNQRDLLTVPIVLDRDMTVYIPFFESYKIFGRIILNRSKYSNLGNVPLSNIKITAYDSEGNMFTALTDKAGNFLLYVPSVDQYTVKINNIFFENFDIPQTEYVIQFNGYKQFELSYIFTEKERKIVFDKDYENLEFGFGSNTKLEPPPDNNTTNNNPVIDNNNNNKTNGGSSKLIGRVIDKNTGKPVNALIEVVDNLRDEVVQKTTADQQGNYQATIPATGNYTVVVSSQDYWYYSENVGAGDGTTKVKDIELTNVLVGSEVQLNNISFEVGRADLKASSYTELDRFAKLLIANPNYVIEISGHADISGSERVNKKVSRERAKVVVDYLVKHGVNEKQLEWKGFGTSKPIAPNDTEEGRTKNRRVDVKMLNK